MTELGIDTSTETASIVLSEEGQVRAEMNWHAGRNHTTQLVPNLVHLLGQMSVSLPDLTAIFIARGPGSFTGLRVGMGTAKGLAFALRIPLVSVGTLEVEALPHAIASLPVCPLFDAGRGEVATAVFQPAGGELVRLVEEHITTLEALLKKVRRKTVFCGQVPPPVAEALRARLGSRALVVQGAGLLRRGGYLAELGWRRLRQGEQDDAATLQPLYLRRPPVQD